MPCSARPAIEGSMATPLPIDSPAALLDLLRELELASPADLDSLGKGGPDRWPTAQALTAHLVKRGVLTDYQVERLLRGEGHELVLGQYRLLEVLGRGG